MRNRIQDLRRERRMTQEELAQVCHVSRQTILSLEAGRYNPSIFLAYKIAKVFHQTIEQVFLFEEESV